MESSRIETSGVRRAGEIGKDCRSNSVEGSRTPRGGTRDQNSGVTFGTPSVRGQTFGDVKHQVLLDRIPMVQDVQSAWLLHCACARANHLLRVVRPSAAANFEETHDRAVWQCLANILRIRMFWGRSGCRRHGSDLFRPVPLQANTALGQCRKLTCSGLTYLGQCRFRPTCRRRVGPRREEAPKVGAPKVEPRRVGGAQNFALFSLSRHNFFLSSSLGGPFVEFWCCF